MKATEDIIAAQNQLAIHRHEFFLCPDNWLSCKCDHITIWQIARLSELEAAKIPQDPGIYTLLVQPGIVCHPACSYLMYVGKTKALKRRFGEYLSERNRTTGRPKILRLLNMYADHIWFCFTVVPEKDLDTVEKALMDAYLPPANDQFSAEVRPAIGAF